MKPFTLVTLIALVLVLAVSSRAPEARADEKAPWQSDFRRFVGDFDKDAHADLKTAIKTYQEKTVKWKLTFKSVEKNAGGTMLQFDLEPYGIQPPDPKHAVLVAFRPAFKDLENWRKVKAGTVVVFEGKIVSVSAPQIKGRTFVMAGVHDIKLVSEEKK